MKLVIIGGVAGGASAAARARRLNETAEIVLFERGEFISFANCGLPYHVGGVIAKRDNLLLMTPERFKARTGIDVRVRQEVTAIDPAAHTVTVRNLASGETYAESYDKLILAPGSSPVRPPLPGIDDPAVMVLWTIPDMDRIMARIDAGARRAVVVGGGFIGLEVAENLRHRGVEVTLVEMLPQVLPPLDPEMTAPLAQELERNGIRLLTGAQVAGIRRHTLTDDSQTQEVTVDLAGGGSIPADLVVLSIGVRPNSELARAAGLETGPRGGIVVNPQLQTSHPDIYAVGDAIQVTDLVLNAPAQIPLAGPANRQGRLAADNVFGAGAAYKGTLGTAVVKVFDLTAACVGASEKTLKKAGTAHAKVYLHPFSHATYYPGAQQLHLKLLFAPDGRILGAQAVGRDGADKRIDVIATAMKAGLKVQDLADLELAYAPPYGSAKDPVNFAGMTACNLLEGKTSAAHADALPAGAFLLDVREPAEFEAGAIPGATLIPLGQLRRRLDELPKDREIVAYCAVGIRGYIAECILRPHGFTVKNLSGGFTTWKLFHPAAAAPGPRPGGSPATPPPPAGKTGGTCCGGSTSDDREVTPCGAPVQTNAKPADSAAPARTAVEAELLDVRGQQCPGPIVAVKQTLDRLAAGATLRILASDSGFLRDLPSFCESTGHRLLSLSEAAPGRIEAVVAKCAAGPAAVQGPAATGPKRTAIVLFSNDLDRAMAGLIIANGFAALGHEVTLFFTFWGLTVLRKAPAPAVKKDILSRMFGFMLPTGAKKLALSKLHMLGAGTAMMKHVMRQKNVPSLPELIGQARLQGVKFLACEMAMNVMGIQKEELLDGIETAGVANFAAVAEKSSATLFI